MMCSSAAVADGNLHTLVIMSGYLSYCCLSIFSSQSVHSPPTSDSQTSPPGCCLAQTTMPNSKSLKFPFFHILK